MFRVSPFSDLYADACVRNEHGQLLFISLYGRDTQLRALMAAFHLGVNEGGVSSIQLINEQTGEDSVCYVGDAKKLTHTSGRLPKDNLFGNVVHTFIYREDIVKPDLANAAAWILRHQSLPEFEQDNGVDTIWEYYKTLSAVPLQDHWRDFVIAHTAKDCIFSTSESNYPTLGNFTAIKIQLPSDFTQRISKLVKMRIIGLEAPDSLETQHYA